MQPVQTTSWYPEAIPPELGSDRLSMSTQTPADLNGKKFDYLVIGSGIGGSSAASYIAQTELKNPGKAAPVSILMADTGRFFNGKSVISGGEISAGLGIGSEWARAAWGHDTADDFLRHTMLATRYIRKLCDRFEGWGYDVRTSSGLITAITDDTLEDLSARREAKAYSDIIAHDVKYRNTPGPDQPVSMATFASEFENPRFIAAEDMIGGRRYKRGGILIPWEGAVNPAMLGIAMKNTVKGELRGGWGENIDMHIQEFLHVETINPASGVVTCRDMKSGDIITFEAGHIILAGVSPKIVQGINLQGEHQNLNTMDYRTIIAVTEPLRAELLSRFTSAVHDTTRNYNYFWADQHARRVMWGTGDYNVFPDMPVTEMLGHVNDEMGMTLGEAPKTEWLWSGDIPYTGDGLPAVFKTGRVSGWIAPGGNGLAASVALASIVCGAQMGNEQKAALLENMMKRKAGFDANAVSAETPDFLKPAPFKVAPPEFDIAA